MVRTREWKYVHRYPDGPHELYHLARDPDERTNLAGDPAAAAMRGQLRARLDAWFAQYVDPAFDGAHAYITGCGQLDRMPVEGDPLKFFADVPIKPLHRQPQTLEENR